ncbi:hypothetical protein L1281_000669 [Neisseria sp. HSC-16F19]|nr:hypothetical protein [Neisseria sp. HSC-16F19]MCP2040089.1 hypothetical protein [Neisseria sp. HSC-16F19]
MHYDHISFHTDEDWPAGLPESHAAHHMGFYYSWAVGQGLYSEAAARLPDFERLAAGTLSGAQFVLTRLNGGLDETCFNDAGRRFTAFYYADEDEGYGRFMEDYVNTLNTPALGSFYHTEDSAANQALLNLVFDAAWAQWQASLRGGEV